MLKLVTPRIALFRTGVLVLLSIAAMESALTQPGEATLAVFETVSVHASPAVPAVVEMVPASGTFSAQGITVRQLAALAYGVDGSKISGGPDWLDTETYEIHAQLTFATSSRPARMADAVKEPLQRLLFGYFGIQAHSEQERLYILEAEPSARGLRISVDSTTERSEQSLGQLRLEGAELQGLGVELDDLAEFLGVHLGRPVLNHTRLVGNYDFSLSMPTDSSDVDVLVSAIRQQLGLNLRWVIVDVTVIDRANAEPPSLDQ